MATFPPFDSGAARSASDTSRRFRRSRRSELMIWWREIDRVLLGLVLLLMAIGTAAVAAASPASARRLSTPAVQLGDLYFFILHLRWQMLGFAAMFGASLLPREWARRAGILLGFLMIAALMLVPFIGTEVNGARRWLNIGVSLQPSEFLKPAFAIALAWVLSWRVRDPNLPVVTISVGLMGLVAALLMMQPDFGSTILFVGVWFVLVLLSGLSLQRIGIAAAAGVTALFATYFLYENGRHRIDAFLGGGTEFDQVDLAQKTLLAGGAYRLYSFGNWRRVRSAGLRCDRASLSGDCHPRAVAACRGRRPVHGARGDGPDRAVRRAGVHQHSRQPATVSVEGHDVAAD